MKLLLTTWLRTLLISTIISIPLGNILIYPISYFEEIIGDPLGWAKYEGLGGIVILFFFWAVTFLSVSFWQGLKARKRLIEGIKVTVRQADYLFLFTLATSVLLIIPIFTLFFIAFEFFSVFIFAPIGSLFERFRI